MKPILLPVVSRVHNNDILRLICSLFFILHHISSRCSAFTALLPSKSMQPACQCQSKFVQRTYDVATVGHVHRSQSKQMMMMMMTDGNNDIISFNLLLLLSAASQTEPWVQPLSNVLDPFLNFMSFAMLSRVVLSWYPEIVASNNNNNDKNGVSSAPPFQQQPPSPSPLLQLPRTEIDTTESSESNDAVSASTVTTTTPEQSSSSSSSLPIWIKFIVIPTQPLLLAVKDIVPPAFGVDITPVFWLAIFTFIHEILLGQQGLLTMKIKYGI